MPALALSLGGFFGSAWRSLRYCSFDSGGSNISWNGLEAKTPVPVRAAENRLVSKTSRIRGARQMTISELSRYALTISVAAKVLAGCGGSRPPIGASEIT
jgi:hypothetical protein